MQLETGNPFLFCQKQLSATLLSYHTLSVLIDFSVFNIFVEPESTSILSFSRITRESAYQVRWQKMQLQTEVFKLYPIMITPFFNFPVKILMFKSPISILGVRRTVCNYFWCGNLQLAPATPGTTSTRPTSCPQPQANCCLHNCITSGHTAYFLKK